LKPCGTMLASAVVVVERFSEVFASIKTSRRHFKKLSHVITIISSATAMPE